jgi:hypothetical protein
MEKEEILKKVMDDSPTDKYKERQVSNSVEVASMGELMKKQTDDLC